jgi:molybdate transport system substrate-binding protein
MPMTHWLRRTLALGSLLLGLVGQAQAHETTVAAAADLKFALDEVSAQFHADTGRSLRLIYGSSGNFTRQIEQGAPIDLFLSADEEFVQRLVKAGLTRDGGALYAIGRLALVVPHGSPLKADATLADLGAALKDGRLRHFAIANPAHAPYGLRAEEALQHAGLWAAIQPKLVLGENVAQAAQFATSGAAQGGLVAYALAIAPQVSAQADVVQIPADWHQPLRQRMVLLKNAGTTAEAFYRYLQQPKARGIMKRFGFALPNE